MRNLLLIVLTLLLLTACSTVNDNSAPQNLSTKAAATESSSSAKTTENTITIVNFRFEPQELVVAVGTEVTWLQEDKVVHTIVSEGLFESEVLKRGESFSYAFTAPGEYDYYCGIHPSMAGKVIVK